jgi:hypothetical protein
MKGHFRRGPEKRLDATRILDTGQLDQQAVDALAHDRRLDHPGLIHATADNFQALLQRGACPRRDRRLGRLYLDLPGRGGDLHVGTARARGHA